MGSHYTHVYAVMRKRADNGSGKCWPSHKTIAADSGLSVRRVQQVLVGLREAGWIDWEQRRPDGKDVPNTSNVYRVYGVADRRGNSTGAQDVPTGAHQVPTGAQDVPTTPRQDVPTGAHQVPTELRTKELEPSSELVPLVAEATIDDRPDITEVIRYLSQSLDELGVKHEPTKEWRNVIRLMIDRDGITPEQIVGAIRWAHADDFWRGNILSPRSLRKHFEQMRMQAQRPRGQQQTPVNQALQLAAQYAQMGI